METAPGEQPAEGPQSKDASGLSGWAGIEATVVKDDEGKMKGYSEDIDTLLVFAGLFSAILTAFVVQTYQMLQPSSADLTNHLLTTNNQMLAQNSQILVQGFSAVLTGSPFSPPELTSPDDPPPFQPSTSARWVNTLFFTSLVLSLAAALLGILVKQWVREYMQWNSPLATPRENIMVRQFRLEAWETWNVSAIVSTVPALLEVAMILFLIGMIILLWILDDVVAICLTAATAMFLLVVAVFTVLPVFSRRCPYKSPTAWAVMAACEILSHSSSFCLKWGRSYTALLQLRWPRFIRAHNRHLHRAGSYIKIPRDFIQIILLGEQDDELEQHEHVEWKRLPLSWRDVDLSSCKTMVPRFGSWQLKYETMHATAAEALSVEALDGSEQNVTMNELFIEVKETVLLQQALSWVAKSSQNSHVIMYVNQCHDEEQRLHEHTLNLFLRAAAREFRDGFLSRIPASEVRRFLLQLALDHSKHYNTSAMLHRAYVDALQDCRIIPSVADRRLVLEQGFTTAADCELLLMSYFPSEFTHADPNLLKMFITTATRWLRRCDMRLASGEVVVGILEKMVKVADVLSEESAAPLDTMSQGSDDVEVRVDHQEWIRKLNWERTTLTEQYGALYRRLLHALEKAYKCNKLCGDQKRIRELLHDVLEVSHNECGPICEVDGCPWIGHDEPFNLPFHDECDLLSKSTAAGAHGGERLSESEPLSSSGPQSSSSSQPVVSSDSPEGLAHAEPHRTVSHEGLPTPAINTSEHWSSRCSFLATEHNTRRHAMGRVREARSMDELTRPGVTRLEPGRQSSWG